LNATFQVYQPQYRTTMMSANVHPSAASGCYSIQSPPVSIIQPSTSFISSPPALLQRRQTDMATLQLFNTSSATTNGMVAAKTTTTKILLPELVNDRCQQRRPRLSMRPTTKSATGQTILPFYCIG
jgi:hypothetical protein